MTNARRLAVAAAAVCALLVAWGAASGAQSGRRSQKPISPVPTPTPTPAPEQGESESVGRGRSGASSSTAQLTLTVYESDDTFSSIPREASELVMNTFRTRLSASHNVAVTSGGGRISRKEAQRLAKTEQKAYVLVLQLAEDVSVGRESVGRADTRLLAIKLYTYEPVTGALKYTDTIEQRPYRQTTTVGGVRIPLPTRNPRIERFPSELQLEQAAREAADRVMIRFDITVPPDNQ